MPGGRRGEIKNVNVKGGAAYMPFLVLVLFPIGGELGDESHLRDPEEMLLVVPHPQVGAHVCQPPHNQCLDGNTLGAALSRSLRPRPAPSSHRDSRGSSSPRHTIRHSPLCCSPRPPPPFPIPFLASQNLSARAESPPSQECPLNLQRRDAADHMQTCVVSTSHLTSPSSFCSSRTLYAPLQSLRRPPNLFN